MRNFGGIAVQAFQGILNVRAVKLQGIATAVVPINIVWSVYGASTLTPNVAVGFDFSAQAFVSLDQIRSVYIDNLGSSSPVFVTFPDTSYTIVAKPNSEGWYPAYTNSQQFVVTGLGFNSASLPVTEVLVSNAVLPPAVNNEIDTSVAYWLASSQITRGTTIYNQNLGTPALGDQFTTAVLNLATDANIQSNLFGTPYTTGFIYIVDCMVFIASPTTAANGGNQLFFESTGIAGVFLAPTFSIQSTILTPGLAIVQQRGNWKLDATQTWRVRNSVQSGAMQGAARFDFTWTYNPN